MLMAHQDVVPPLDSSSWTYPPFQAHFDGDFLWGRGSADCKNNLIAVLSSVEALLEQSFRPRRGILLAFGFDEETGGFRGAETIADRLQRNMGNNSVAMILDEGGMGVKTIGDAAYALPGKSSTTPSSPIPWIHPYLEEMLDSGIFTSMPSVSCAKRVAQLLNGHPV